MSRLVVGVDVSQAELVVAVGGEGHGAAVGVGTFENKPTGFERIQRVVEQAQREVGASEVHLVLEPTGGYEQPFARWALQQGWRVSLPNPRHIRDWARGRGYRAKTDRVDARVLAEYGSAQELPAWRPVPAEVEELEHLVQRQEDLTVMLRQERNRRHALEAQGTEPGWVRQDVERHISYLEEALEQVQQAMHRHLDEHPDLRQQADRLLQVPGIGQRNRWWILVTLYRWGTLTDYQGSGKGLTAYVGLDPQPYQSGRSVYRHAGISRQGNSMVRRLLYMGALGGVRGRNALRLFYQRLVGRGKPKRLALVAAAHKILIWAWAVFRARTDFRPELATAAS